MPLVGNPTAAVLYPGKVIYALLPYPWAARVYVVFHTAAGLRRDAGPAAVVGGERDGLDPVGAGLRLRGAGAVPVLQHHLPGRRRVDAPGLPRRRPLAAAGEAMGAGRAGRRPGDARAGRRPRVGLRAGHLRRRVRAGPGVGEDARGPIAVGLAEVAGRRPWSRSCWRSPGWRARWSWRRGSRRCGRSGPPTCLHWPSPGCDGCRRRSRRRGGSSAWSCWPDGGGGGIGAGRWGRCCWAWPDRRCWRPSLAAAQLLPVLEFSGQTGRAAGEGPHDIYPFSLDPIRVVELAWPNVFGTHFAGNRSWLEVLPPHGRHGKAWVPSLYLGGLSLVLALGAMGFRGGHPGRGWLSAVAVVTLAASLGEYTGPLWWARWEPSIAARVGPHDPGETTTIRLDGQLRDGDGGFYWTLATALPGFRQFRYPSKLLSFSTLALAGLAGLGWDRLTAGLGRRRTAAAGGRAAGHRPDRAGGGDPPARPDHGGVPGDRPRRSSRCSVPSTPRGRSASSASPWRTGRSCSRSPSPWRCGADAGPRRPAPWPWSS